MPHFQQMECGLLAEEMEKRKLKNIQIVLIVIKRASRSKTVVGRVCRTGRGAWPLVFDAIKTSVFLTKHTLFDGVTAPAHLKVSMFLCSSRNIQGKAKGT